MSDDGLYVPVRPVRVLTAAALFDGHDAAINIMRRLLQAHPNLYAEIKIDPMDPGLNSPLDGGATGKVKPEWSKLFQDFPDRFVIGCGLDHKQLYRNLKYIAVLKSSS